MKNWKAILGVIVVFVLGLIAGGLITAGIVRHRLMTKGPEIVANAVVRRLSWELRLDAGQRQQLRVIVTDAQHDMKIVRRQLQPQVLQILDDSVAKLRATLRRDQQEKLDRIVAERRAKWMEAP